MAFDLELEEGYTPWHLRRLRQHHRHAQSAVVHARARYASLRSAPDADDLELRQALERVYRTAQQLADIELTLKLLEDPQCAARAWQ